MFDRDTLRVLQQALTQARDAAPAGSLARDDYVAALVDVTAALATATVEG
jgi:hypothetical protein